MRKSIVVLSGGTATNALVPLFTSQPHDVSFILPISDNGGSSSEVIRVIGGPAIGDIRSRLIRLIPDNQKELRELLSHRLDGTPKVAKTQWGLIVDGSHDLWRGIPVSTKEIVRSFLLHIHVELLKRTRIHNGSSTEKQFKFECANIGNLFLTAVRLFTGSLDSAIELFMKITDIDPRVEVLPCLNTNFTYHISAILADGSIITGQSQISHPSSNHVFAQPVQRPSFGTALSNDRHELMHTPDIDESDEFSDEEVGNTPMYTHPELKKSQLHFDKGADIVPLLSPIERIFYISPYGEEICPSAQVRVLSKISKADVVIYSIGSLMTSIVPIIILKGVGNAIACGSPESKKRVLLLNGSEDRETAGLKANDYIRIILESAQYSIKKSGHMPVPEYRNIITHLFYMRDPKVQVDIDVIRKFGVTCVAVERSSNEADEFDLQDLQTKLVEIAT